MTPYEDIAPNLPFPSAIDWQNTVLSLPCLISQGEGVAQISRGSPACVLAHDARSFHPGQVLFGGGLQCSMNEQFERTVAWFKALLAPENAHKLACMGRRAQRVFTKYLSLRDEGVLSALQP
jgi:hypothetical protein